MFTKTDIEKYFNEEKKESLLFMLLGTAAIIAALVFLFLLKMNFYQGAAIPLSLVGIMLYLVGYTVYKRSDENRKRNVYAYDMAPADLKEKELPRMKKVMRNFVIYRYAELFLLLVGAGLYIYFTRDAGNDFWRGAGMGLAIMALLTLVADYFAERRGKGYTKGIETFLQGN